MTTDASPPQPTTLQKLATAVYPSFAMLAGMQLDVFTPLDQGPMTAGQLAETLGVTAEKLSRLLYALVTADLLTVHGEQFANTPEAAQFLVRGKPTYLGGRHENFAEIWAALLHTADTIRTGMPQARKDFAATSPEEQMQFFRGLHPGTVATGRMLAAREDFSTVIDLPTVTPITHRFVEEAHATDRIQVVAADVVKAPLPGAYDVAVLRALLQVLSPDDAFQALQHIGAALNPGGRLYIVGRVLDDSRLSPLGTVGFNLVFLNMFDAGRAYTEREHREWLTAIGLTNIERTLIAEDNSIITAYKPAETAP
jgi:hypothetical protein